MLRKIWNKYNLLLPPAKASLWFLVCGFLQKGIAMITTPIFTRIMTEAEYGRYNIYNSWLNIITIIVSLNLAAGVYTRGLVKNEEDQDVFSSSLMGLSTLCIGVGLVIYLIFHKVINDLLNITTFLMLLMFVEIWLTSVFQFWSNRERVNYRYKKLVVVTSLYVLLSPLLGVLLILFGSPENQVEARVVGVVIVCIICYFGFFVSIICKGKCFIHLRYWKYALAFNLPLVPHYLSQIVLNQSDRVMIGSMCGNAEAAYYSVAYSLAMVMLIFNNAVSSTMNPWIYKSLKDNKYKQIGDYSYIILLFVALINFVMVALGPELLKVMAPLSYYSAVWVIPPVTASVYFMFLYNLFATFEYYFEKTQYVMIASVIGAGVNVILNYFFIQVFGYVAAGYTTLVCYALYAFAHYIFMRKVCNDFLEGIKIYNAGIILLIGIGLIIACGVMMALYTLPIVRYIFLCSVAIFVFLRRNKFISILRSYL